MDTAHPLVPPSNFDPAGCYVTPLTIATTQADKSALFNFD